MVSYTYRNLIILCSSLEDPRSRAHDLEWLGLTSTALPVVEWGKEEQTGTSRTKGAVVSHPSSPSPASAEPGARPASHLDLDPTVRYGLAFSGGTDSALLLAELLAAGCDVVAYTVRSAFQAPFEADDAAVVAERLGARHEVLDVDVLSHADVAANPPDRCYLCKRVIFSTILARMREDGRTVLCDGTNASDDPARRPGMRALVELGVRSPLREAGLTKDDVRALSRELGLPTAEKPSFSCYATRVPTGESLTPASLARAAATPNDVVDGWVARRGSVMHPDDAAAAGIPQVTLRADLDALLGEVAAGRVSCEDASRRIALAPLRDLGYATVDTQRGLRTGAGEVVYGEGKTAEQIVGIVLALLDAGQPRVLVTRLSAEKAQVLATGLSARAADMELDYRALSRLGVVGGMPEPGGCGRIVVAAAGTSDLPVAEEAAVTAEFLGNEVVRAFDVGVAGIHRLLARASDLAGATCVVAVAGMEGALASVVGGLVSCPVIAVPTSVGYGASFGGIAALLAMMNSCASGVSVVNIDNGFGAGYQASLINHVRPAHTSEQE